MEGFQLFLALSPWSGQSGLCVVELAASCKIQTHPFLSQSSSSLHSPSLCAGSPHDSENASHAQFGGWCASGLFYFYKINIQFKKEFLPLSSTSQIHHLPNLLVHNDSYRSPCNIKDSPCLSMVEFVRHTFLEGPITLFKDRQPWHWKLPRKPSQQLTFTSTISPTLYTFM